MAANTTPIFGKNVRNSYITTGTAANTNFDGTGTVATVFTADATNGSKVETVTFTHMGTNIATVLRIFVNNGSTNATAANNSLIYETTMAAYSASQTAASTQVIWQGNVYLPAGYKLNVTTGTGIASGVMVNAQGSDF